jgi:hypothetical protein
LPPAFENAPLTIVSAPISVRRGQLIRIHGWIRIPQPIQSSPDGVKIYDSAGGPQLALRRYETDGWQQFVSYRAAKQDGALVITFELTGLGEVALDDVEVTLHEPISDQYPASPADAMDQARRLPPAVSLQR